MTHTFDFSVGSEFIRGEFEIVNNKANYSIQATSSPFSNDFLEQFTSFMVFVVQMNKSIGVVKKIKLIQI